MVGSAGRIDE
jgi:hypothetical protein